MEFKEIIDNMSESGKMCMTAFCVVLYVMSLIGAVVIQETTDFPAANFFIGASIIGLISILGYNFRVAYIKSAKEIEERKS